MLFGATAIVATVVAVLAAMPGPHPSNPPLAEAAGAFSCADSDASFPVASGSIGWVWWDPAAPASEGDYHSGIDIWGPNKSGIAGYPVYAPFDGVVTRVGPGVHIWSDSLGADVYLGHISPAVGIGGKVYGGSTVIGYVDSSGHAHMSFSNSQSYNDLVPSQSVDPAGMLGTKPLDYRQGVREDSTRSLADWCKPALFTAQWFAAPEQGSAITDWTLLALHLDPSVVPVHHVNFTTWWPALGPESGPWKIMDCPADPYMTGVYQCWIDLSNQFIPVGSTVKLSADVWAADGRHVLAPAGVITVGYITPQLGGLGGWPDLVPPSISWASTPAQCSANPAPAASVSATDDRGDVRIRFKVDGGVWGAWGEANTLSLSGLGHGSHTAYAEAADPSGNVASTSYQFIVDLQAATLSGTIVGPEAYDHTYLGKTVVQVVAEDGEFSCGIDPIMVDINGAGFMATESGRIELTKSGMAQIRAYVQDRAGNRSGDYADAIRLFTQAIWAGAFEAHGVTNVLIDGPAHVEGRVEATDNVKLIMTGPNTTVGADVQLSTNVDTNIDPFVVQDVDVYRANLDLLCDGADIRLSYSLRLADVGASFTEPTTICVMGEGAVLELLTVDLTGVVALVVPFGTIEALDTSSNVANGNNQGIVMAARDILDVSVGGILDGYLYGDRITIAATDRVINGAIIALEKLTLHGPTDLTVREHPPVPDTVKPLFAGGPAPTASGGGAIAPKPPALSVEASGGEVCGSASTLDGDVGFDWQFEPADGSGMVTLSTMSTAACAPATAGPMTVRVRAVRSEASAWVSTMVEVPSVGNPAVALTLVAETFTAYAGGTIVVDGEVTSSDGFEGWVTISAVVPAGFGSVMSDSTYLGNDDGDPFDLSIAIPSSLAPGEYTIDIVAQGSGVTTKTTMIVTVPQRTVSVLPTTATVSVRRSYSSRVDGIVRAGGFDGWAYVKVYGLPANVSAASDLVTLGGGQDSFSLTVRASSRAVVGTYTARLIVESTSGVILAETPITIIVK